MRHASDDLVLAFNSLQSLAYGGIALYGERLQSSMVGAERANSWMVGHLSDITMVAMSVAAGQLFAGRNVFVQYLFAAVPPIACTLHELGLINLNPSASTYDSQDILCYWAGAMLAFGASKIVANRIAKQAHPTIDDAVNP